MSGKGTSEKIVGPYAYALLKLIYTDFNINVFTNVILDAFEILLVLRRFPDIEKFLKNPTNTNTKKKKFLNTTFKKSFDQRTLNFLMLLIDNKRIDCLESIVFRFLEIVLKTTNHFLVEVEAAVNLFDPIYAWNQQKIYNILANWFKKTRNTEINYSDLVKCFIGNRVTLKLKVNPSVIGGFKLNFKTQSKVIDLTIANKIREISMILGSYN